MDITTPGAQDEAVRVMKVLARETLEISSEIHLLFVTSIRDGEMTDLGPDGLLNEAQRYTHSQAEAIARSLQGLGVTVETFFSEQDFLRAVAAQKKLGKAKHDVVFTTAEGGTGSGRRALIPALCNLLSLPVLNSASHACSLARHKFHANAVLRRIGIRAPETWQFRNDRWTGGLKPLIGSRVIVKPTYESMCIGVDAESVQVVDFDFESFVADRVQQFGQPVVVQEFVSGEEVGVPIARIGATHALPPVAFLRANGEPFNQKPRTFSDENITRDTSFVPFACSKPQDAALRSAAIGAFDALEMAGAGRIDFRLDGDGRAWVIDTNESPPPLAHTSYAKTMEGLGFSLEEMLGVWLGICLFDSGLISGI